MIICSIGDFVGAFIFGAVAMVGLYIGWKLWRLVDSARKHARPK